MIRVPQGWTVAPLDEVADVRLGRQRSPANHSGTSMRPYLRAANVDWDGLRLDDVKDMNFTDAEMDVYRLELGDILLGEASGSPREVGKPALWNGEIDNCAFQNTLIRVRPFGPEPRYLLHYFRHLALSGAFAAQSRGVGIHHLGRAKLASWSIPIPPLNEQRCIVEILEDHLSRLDAGEQDLRRGQAQLQLLERALVDDVFHRQAEAEGWPVVTLEALAAPDRRAITDGPFGSNLTSSHYRASGAKVLRLQNIGDGFFRRADAYISLDHYEALKSHEVRAGDVVVASLGEALPRAAVVPDLQGPAIVKADCIRVRLRKEIDPTWLVLACRSTKVKKWAGNRVHGVGRQRLGMQGIREIPVPLPESAETRARIVASWKTQAAELARLQSSIESGRTHLTGLRRALLEAAFSGRLTEPSVEHDLVKEPTSV